MADIAEVLVTRLTGFAGLTALIGQRVYPKVAPQNPTLPYVTYQKVSQPNEVFMGDTSTIEMPRFQVDAWAKTETSVIAVAQQVRDALHLWNPGATDPPVLQSRKENELGLYEADTQLRRISQDFEVWYSD